jgi:hypothetical protein
MFSGPLSRKARWCWMMARVTLMSVVRRCSIASISHCADWNLRLSHSRALGSPL